MALFKRREPEFKRIDPKIEDLKSLKALKEIDDTILEEEILNEPEQIKEQDESIDYDFQIEKLKREKEINDRRKEIEEKKKEISKPQVIYKARAVSKEDMFNILLDRIEVLESQMIQLSNWANKLSEYLEKTNK